MLASILYLVKPRISQPLDNYFEILFSVLHITLFSVLQMTFVRFYNLTKPIKLTLCMYKFLFFIQKFNMSAKQFRKLVLTNVTKYKYAVVGTYVS